MTGDENLIGLSLPRREDARFLTGQGCYVADLRPTGGLHVAIVRSMLAAARILSVDTREAATAPGVVAVLTAADLTDDLGPLPVLTTPDPRFAESYSLRFEPPRIDCIADGEVHYVGEPVAVVVASDRYLAEDAADLVQVDYEPLEAVTDPEEAVREGSRAVHSSNPDNVVLELSIARGGLPEVEPDQHVVIERDYSIGRHSGVPIEGRGVVASPRDDGVDVWTSTQIPFLVRRAICTATGWSHDEVRVRTPDVGGGFGPKANVYPEEILIPVVARRLGEDVQWIEDRHEHLVSSAQARDQRHHCRLVVDREGHILSWEDDFVVDIGSHNLWMAGTVANTAIHLLGAYRIPAFRFSGRAVLTNKTPTSQYRGAGRPEATYALERSLDAAARALGISRLKMRERNLLTADDLPHPQGIPYRDGVDIVYDGRDYRAVLDVCQRLVPEPELRELREEADARGDLLGVGVATFVEATGRGPFEAARVRVLAGGTVEVHVGTASAGMAHETTLAQVASSCLRRPLETVVVRTGDTAGVPDSLGSFASRTAVVAGSAIQDAAERLVELIRERLATREGIVVDEVEHGAEGFRTPSGTVTWDEVPFLADADGVVEALGRFEPETVTWTMGAHLAVVSIDPETGHVRVVRYAAADEAGRAINPQVVEGQIKGGIAQGIGGGLLEEFRYDEAGQPQSTTLADYLLPGTGEVPRIDLGHVEVPSERNRMGLKGVGESGTIPGCAVLASAVEDALRPFDVQVTATPIRSRDVRGWIRGGRP